MSYRSSGLPICSMRPSCIIRRGIIREHDDVAHVVVVHVVKRDTGFFAEPRDEREIALAVLCAARERRKVFPTQPQLALDVPFFEQRFDDVGNGFSLEDAIVLILRQPKEPRNDTQFVCR
jgi:hypothetical protein